MILFFYKYLSLLKKTIQRKKKNNIRTKELSHTFIVKFTATKKPRDFSFGFFLN